MKEQIEEFFDISKPPKELSAYLAYLYECSYRNVIVFGNNFACLHDFIYTCAIITGRLFEDGYNNRWCYHNKGMALRGLDAWHKKNFQGEPEGWHRHPMSGRRRENGDPAKEYINF
jgi:hypothetical protein